MYAIQNKQPKEHFITSLVLRIPLNEMSGSKIGSVFVDTAMKVLSYSCILYKPSSEYFLAMKYYPSQLFSQARQVAAEEKRKAQREQAFIPPVEEKPKKETKKKGMMILFLYYYFLVVSMVYITHHFYCMYIYHRVLKAITLSITALNFNSLAFLNYW